MPSLSAKSYHQTCSVARALDIIGDRWTLLIVRELLSGPKRYGELKKFLAGMNATLLSDRLKQLEGHGVVCKIELSAPVNAAAYALTAAGAALEPVILALVRWGLVHAPPPFPDAHSHPHWAVVAMRALFNPSRAADIDIACQFLVAGSEFYAIIKHGRFISGIGRLPIADVTISCSAEIFGAFNGSAEMALALVDAGAVELRGARQDFLRFAACLEPPVGAS